MNDSWIGETPIGEWLEKSYPSRISFAGAMLRLVGWLGAFYCAAIVVILCLRWLGWTQDLARYGGELPIVGKEITGYGFRLVLFLLTYAAGTILPILIRPEKPADKPAEE